MKIRALLAAALFLAGASAASAVTVLTPGDISIVGYRSDANDALSFVTWVTIDPGATITFTDNGYDGGGDGSGIGAGGGTWGTGEEVAVWQNNSGFPVNPGTVVVGSFSGSGASWNIGISTGELDGLANAGDAIFAYQGSGIDGGGTFSGTPLFGLNFGGAWTTAGAISSSGTDNSYLPSSLNSPALNFFDPPSSPVHPDNGRYNGPMIGDPAVLKLAVTDPANWIFNNDGAAFGTLPNGGFELVVSAVPEPSRILLLVVGIASAALRRRRRR
ncbi:MAG: PEP-CTERM sorting domain-containing protein [Verrucomicrobiales bacterium]